MAGALAEQMPNYYVLKCSNFSNQIWLHDIGTIDSIYNLVNQDK